ncbi:hypothetical protein EYF80_015641 [Liparis tanakae]|uniref:Uncharacterized protein n=1 Tax=Liparis tanakae TaxID=230148 RepID=A0A4Z2I819_9TELE|nr:hypothetical protein EYF80_015641 [Liparis tanakae]
MVREGEMAKLGQTNTRVAVNLLNIKRKQQNHDSPPLSTKPSSMSLLPEPPSTSSPAVKRTSSAAEKVQKVVDGFIHKLGATCDGHKVRVWSSTLGKPEIDLEKMDSKPSTTGYFKMANIFFYLVFIALLWELDVDVVLSADGCYDGALAADDFRLFDALQEALFGAVEGDLIALSACAREAHHHATIFISQVPEDLAAASHKVAVVLWINDHIVLDDVVLKPKSEVPTTMMSSWSLSSAVGKMILAPVLSRTLRMFPPPFPMRNLWYSGLARSSAVASSCCLAFSTSSAGPRMVTLSIPEPSVGKWMCTPPHSSMMERTKRPFDPIRELCSFEGMDTSISVMFA